jgi:NhaP-type Na+/H+ or K+/H+ antiporter
MQKACLIDHRSDQFVIGWGAVRGSVVMSVANTIDLTGQLPPGQPAVRNPDAILVLWITMTVTNENDR